jgi:hypothetical protein
MKSLIYTSAIIALFFLYSCSDDSSKTPASDLNGTWSGEHIAVNDTAKFECTITEAKGKILGTGELYGYRKIIEGSRIITDEKRIKASVAGTFERPEVQINFRDDNSFQFNGQLSEDKMSLNGQVTIKYDSVETNAEYPVTLFRK